MKTAAGGLSWSRWMGIIVKEFIQLKRDRLTFGMIVGIPVLQLLLFGFAINADPKHLPTAVLAADASPYARSLVAGLQNSGYFRLEKTIASQAEAEENKEFAKILKQIATENGGLYKLADAATLP